MDRHNNPAEIADRRNVRRRGTVAADGASIWSPVPAFGDRPGNSFLEEVNYFVQRVLTRTPIPAGVRPDTHYRSGPDPLSVSS